MGGGELVSGTSEKLSEYILIVVVVLMFYGPSTLFVSFRAWSVNLSTLFLDKPHRQFTSTKCPFFRQSS